MKVVLKLSSFYVGKDQEKVLELDSEINAVQLPNGETLKLGQLKGEALEEYFYQKYIKDGPYDGRVNSIEFYQD